GKSPCRSRLSADGQEQGQQGKPDQPLLFKKGTAYPVCEVVPCTKTARIGRFVDRMAELAGHPDSRKHRLIRTRPVLPRPSAGVVIDCGGRHGNSLLKP